MQPVDREPEVSGTEDKVLCLRHEISNIIKHTNWNITDFKDSYSNNHLIECKAMLGNAIKKLDKILKDEFIG